MDTVECVVIGAGVIGLAVARAFAQAGHEVVVVEAESLIGSGISSRNSEVIHAGIYYPKDSLKARLCVQGKAMLYAYCDSHGVAHRRCGKLIIAADASQLPELERIRAAAEANGVEDLALLTQAKATAMEPALACTAALWSPSTGIIDSHAYMLALQGDAEDAGAVIAFQARVRSLAADSDGIVVAFDDEAFPPIKARLIINAAGLSAPELGLGLEPPARRLYAKGSYFTLTGRSPFSRLIYPTPEPGGLGVHLTLDMGGQAKFGPDVEWVQEPDFTVDPARGERFYAAVRRYWPDLPDGALQPGYAGVRPKLSGPGEPAADFRIEAVSTGAASGLVHLVGIESPGLTSSLAIAELALERARSILT